LWETFTLNNIPVFKSRRTRWAENVARMAGGRDACRVLVGIYEGRRPLGITGVYGRMILNGSLRNLLGGRGLD
jgi:hypothetical protein